MLRELAQRLDVTEEYLATGAHAAPKLALDDAEIALRLDDVEQAAKLFESALKDARDAGERSRAWEGLGQVAYRSGDPALASELFERALSLVGDEVSERPGLAANLARAYAAQGRRELAIDVLQRCVEANEDDPVQYVRFAALLGAALTDSGRFADAERVLEDALVRGRDVDDPYTRLRLYWSEARLRLEQGQSEIAARYALKALELLRTTEDAYGLAHILQTLAHIQLDLDRPHDALDFLDEERELIHAVGTPLDIAQFQIEKARALAAIGESEEAAALATKAANALRADSVDSGRAYALLGGIYADLGDMPRAQEVLELAVELLDREVPNRYLVQACRRLAELLTEKGEHEAAHELLERALSVQQRVGRPLS